MAEPIIEIFDTNKWLNTTEQRKGEIEVEPELREAIMREFHGTVNEPIVTLETYKVPPSCKEMADMGVAATGTIIQTKTTDFATHVVLNKNPDFEYNGVSGRDIALKLGVLPLTIMGVGITEDGYVLLGERKPKTSVSRGSFTTIPGGYCHADDAQPVTLGGFYRELAEELPKGCVSEAIAIPRGLVYSNNMNRGFSVPFLYLLALKDEVEKALDGYESQEMVRHHLVDVNNSSVSLIDFLGEQTEFKPEMLSNHGLVALALVAGVWRYNAFRKEFLETAMKNGYGEIREHDSSILGMGLDMPTIIAKQRGKALVRPGYEA